MEWQIIETAPKDGTRIDLWNASWRESGEPIQGRWDKWENDWVADPPLIGTLGRAVSWEDPTHWRPLTPPHHHRDEIQGR